MAVGKQRGLGRVAFLAAVLVTMTAAGQESAAPAAASADETEAKTLFQAGKFAFESGRYEEALDRWQRSYNMSGRSELLYNLGLAHDRLRHDAQAIEAFEAYLAAHPNSPQETEVRGRVRALKAAQARAPSPAETAAAAPIAEPPVAAAESNRDGSTPWYRKWWVWTLAGAVVAGVVVGVAVAASGDDVGAPVEPNTGVSTFTLVRR